jgi:uncharacterized protein YjgD (DUF1641 family)
MAERLKNIKETASDAVEIIRELGSPDVQESLEKVKETAKVAREIIESLKDPEMVKNIENFRKMSESFENTSTRIEHMMNDLKESGVLDETRETIKSAKNTISSIGGGGENKNVGEMIEAIKEMVNSISGLVDEVKLTVTSSRKEGVIHNTQETIRETRSIFTTEEKSK